jgi:hypothetical protein
MTSHRRTTSSFSYTLPSLQPALYSPRTAGMLSAGRWPSMYRLGRRIHIRCAVDPVVFLLFILNLVEIGRQQHGTIKLTPSAKKLKHI